MLLSQSHSQFLESYHFRIYDLVVTVKCTIQVHS